MWEGPACNADAICDIVIWVAEKLCSCCLQHCYFSMYFYSKIPWAPASPCMQRLSWEEGVTYLSKNSTWLFRTLLPLVACWVCFLRVYGILGAEERARKSRWPTRQCFWSGVCHQDGQSLPELIQRGPSSGRMDKVESTKFAQCTLILLLLTTGLQLLKHDGIYKFWLERNFEAATRDATLTGLTAMETCTAALDWHCSRNSLW